MELAKVDNPDMANFIKYTKLYSYIVGIWPAKKLNHYTYYIYRLRSLILVDFMIYWGAIGTTIKFCLSANSIEQIFQSGFIFLFTWSAAIKYGNYTYRRREILQILNDLDNPVFIPMFSKQNNFIRSWIKIAQYYCKGYATGVLFGCIFFMVFPLLDKTSEQIRYPIDMWFPFDVRESQIYFAFTYFVAGMGVVATGLLNVPLDTLFCVLMNIGTAQIQVLKDTLENAIEYACEENEEVDGTDGDLVELLTSKQEANLIVILNRCIVLHNAINKLFIDIESIFSLGVFSTFFANTLVLCMNAVQLRMNSIKSLQFVTLVEFSGDVFIESSLLCFNGQAVSTQSYTIMDSIYKMNWYRCSIKVRRMIFIMQEKAKTVHVIKAGGIFDLSVTTLVSMCRSTFSFYTVMNQFLDKIMDE